MTDLRNEDALSVLLTWSWPDALIVAVGEIDAFTTPVLERRLREAVDSDAARVVVDASAVTFVALAGLDAFHRAGAELGRRGGELLVADPPPSLRLLVGTLGRDVPFRFTCTPFAGAGAPLRARRAAATRP